MFVTCNKCGVKYDDEYNWTICPHQPLGGDPLPDSYCKKHDLFGPCPFCKPETPREKLHPQTAAIIKENKHEEEPGKDRPE